MATRKKAAVVSDINLKSNQNQLTIPKHAVKDIKCCESKSEQLQKAADTEIKISQDEVEISEDQAESIGVPPNTRPLLKFATGTKFENKKIPGYLFSMDKNLDRLCCAAFSKRNALACGYFNSAVKLWTSVLDSDFESEDSIFNCVSEESQTPEFGTESILIQSSNPDQVLLGHDGAVYGSRFPNKWELLMTCSEDTTVKAWDMKNYENVATYYEHKYPVFDIDISSDSAYFATASKDTTACIWTFERSSAVRTFCGHSSDVDSIRFHPNDKYLASASFDKKIILWTTQDACAVRHFTGHVDYISCIAFSPNGKQLASADENGSIKIWDLGSGKTISEFKAHVKSVSCLNFNRSGTFLASGGFDHYLKVWDVQGSLNYNESQSAASGSVDDLLHVGLFDSHEPDSIYFHHIHFSRNNFLFSVTTKSE